MVEISSPDNNAFGWFNPYSLFFFFFPLLPSLISLLSPVEIT
jgi:hypothetical protein